MTHAKRLWSIWQALLSAFAWAFTRPSFRRFAEWVTAMAINGEEHTITQSVLALERPAEELSKNNLNDCVALRHASCTLVVV